MNAKTIKKIGTTLRISRCSLAAIRAIRIESGRITVTNLDTWVETAAPDGTTTTGPAIADYNQFARTGNLDTSVDLLRGIEDVPVPPAVTPVKELPAAVFNESMTPYLQYAAVDRARECLCNVNIQPDYVVWATDGHRARITHGADGIDCVLSITPEFIQVVDTMLSSGEVIKRVYTGAMTFLDTEYTVLVAETDHTRIVTKLGYNSIPDISNVVPAWKNQNVLTISAENISILRQAIIDLLPYANKKTHLIKIHGSVLYVANNDTRSYVSIKLPFDVSTLLIGINGAYFAEILADIGFGSELRIGMKTAISAITMENGSGLTWLLMPLRTIDAGLYDGTIDYSENDVLGEIDGVSLQLAKERECEFIALPTPAPVKKRAAISGDGPFYLFDLGGCYGITRDAAAFGVMKRLSATEYKQLIKIGMVECNSEIISE